MISEEKALNSSLVYYRRMLSVFEKTESMSTYQLTLSVNHLSVQPIDIDGFKTVGFKIQILKKTLLKHFQVRLISSKNSHDYYSSFYVGNPVTPRTTSLDIK